MTDVTTPTTPQTINDLRFRIVNGQPVTNEELRAAIQYHIALRGRFAEKKEPESKKVAKELSLFEKKQKEEALLKEFGL